MRLIVLIFIPFIIFSCDSEKSKLNRDLIGMESLIGLNFTQNERDSLLPDLILLKNKYDSIRSLNLSNSIPLPLHFNPLVNGHHIPEGKSNYKFEEFKIDRPIDVEECAFYTIDQLSYLIRTKKIKSEDLTKMYLNRLKEFGPQLECVITITEKMALNQARKADIEIENGLYRGPLHGIPYGVKDLLSVKNYKTTWGANTHKEQIINETATVVKKLEESGAVLIAKLTLGALAWGDVWFNGKTRNPWNPNLGSSGSSAGPGSATAAGLVAFSIGSETWGSIVSPSSVNGVTGLRPTYGTVSKAGAMALSWSMDKIGPICRSVDDCALVYNVIKGSDNIDFSVVDVPLQIPKKEKLKELRIGYVSSAFESEETSTNDKSVLSKLEDLGFKLIPIELPEFPTNALSFLLDVEAAAAFDELTRNNKDDELIRQEKMSWPNTFRRARYIPAVEYIQANRARVLLNDKMRSLFKKIDLYVVPSFWGDNLLRTNLTGHPCVVIPNGFDKSGLPSSISFIGDLYEEGNIISIAKEYQKKTNWHKKYPPNF